MFFANNGGQPPPPRGSPRKFFGRPFQILNPNLLIVLKS